MSDIYELSSDSNETIIIPAINSFDEENVIDPNPNVREPAETSFEKEGMLHVNINDDDDDAGVINVDLQTQGHEKEKPNRLKKNVEHKTAKALKQALAIVNKNMKPNECTKFIDVQVDYRILTEEYGDAIVTALQENELKYNITSQISPFTISWVRQKQGPSISEDNGLELCIEDQVTNEILLIMNCQQFLESLRETSLMEKIKSIKVSADKQACLVIYGLQKYKRHFRNQKQREFRSHVLDKAINTQTNKSLPDCSVSLKQIDDVLIELQLLLNCSHRLVESPDEMGLLVIQFTKAVAQIPFKTQKEEKYQETERFAAGDGKDSVKVNKNGNGLQKLWKQMFTTFPLARLETAEAITMKYPTLSALIEAYELCDSQIDAQLLLQDISIRRAAGPLSSSRKIGPELSKKIFSYFSSIDGDVLM